MGISRDSRSKRSKTGAKRVSHMKKRKRELGRAPTSTKIGERKIVEVRCHGGNIKRRALSLNKGTFTIASLGISAQAKILEVGYNTDTSLQRTNTLVKNSVVFLEVEALKKAYYDYKEKQSKLYNQKKEALVEGVLEKTEKQLEAGKILAVITTRPGQEGIADGRVLEGDEHAFYEKRIKVKSSKGGKKQ